MMKTFFIVILLSLCTFINPAIAADTTKTNAADSAGATKTPEKPEEKTGKTINTIFLGLNPFSKGGIMGERRNVIIQSIKDVSLSIEDRLKNANKIFYTGSAGFIVIFVAIYLLWQAGKMLFPFFPLDRVGTVMNSSLTRIMLAIAVTMFTSSAMGPWNNLVAPIMTSGINYASELLFTAACTVTQGGTGSSFKLDGLTCSGNDYTVDEKSDPRISGNLEPKNLGDSITKLLSWIESALMNLIANAAWSMWAGPDGKFGWDDAVYQTSTIPAGIFLVNVLMTFALVAAGLLPYFALGMRLVFFMFGGMILSVMTYFAGIALIVPPFNSFVGFWLKAIIQLSVEIVFIAFAIAISLATMSETLDLFSQTSKPLFAPSHELFLILWGIFFIMNMLVNSAKKLAGALVSGGGGGLDLDAGNEMAQKIQDSVEKTMQGGQQTTQGAIQQTFFK